MFKILEQPAYSDVHLDCLTSLRILTRDKTNLNTTITSSQFNHLLNICQIGQNNIKSSNELIIEALKCLCNLIFNSLKCQSMCGDNDAAVGILNRIKLYGKNQTEYNIKFFDMKLLFLITALNIETRRKLHEEHNGVIILTEFMEGLSQLNQKHKSFTDDEVNIICEVLKSLFNLTVHNVKTEKNDANEKKEDESQYLRLTQVLRTLLIYKAPNKEKQHDLISHTVNLLTNIPAEYFTELFVETNNTKTEFENRDMMAVLAMLEFFKHRLDTVQNAVSQHELLSPVLTVLVKCVRCCNILRRYIRTIVLPPLKDVKKRPEEGNELRNHLCRLLTTPATQVRDLSAELLFVICKENVGRMIKHTGYGNAAGLLANRGLLGGRSDPSCEYSSDSEDSDTEEYKELQHGINPVIGCYEPPRPNPLEGMTEEQKEYEAMKLVNLMDQLHRQGVVQPCRVGEDGRPHAVNHILELQEQIPQQQKDHKRKT